MDVLPTGPTAPGVTALAVACRERIVRAGAPEHEATVDHEAVVLDTLRNRVPADLAQTSVKAAANAIPTTRRVGELGAPCLLGCGGGSGSRAHCLL